MKVKIIGAYSLDELTQKVNEFLSTFNVKDIDEIKYSTVLTDNQFFASCLISYYENYG